MEFHLSPSQIPIPMGLEKETAQLAQAIRQKYEEFFLWVQAGETPAVELSEAEKEALTRRLSLAEGVTLSNQEPAEHWFLETHDIEYFYGLSRPIGVGCACPYGWVEKVNRITDQQYPIFGVERFIRLEEKASHIAWLLYKNEVFPDVLAGIGTLGIFALLERNGISIEPQAEDLKHYFAVLHFLQGLPDAEDQHEDKAIEILAQEIERWEV